MHVLDRSTVDLQCTNFNSSIHHSKDNYTENNMLDCTNPHLRNTSSVKISSHSCSLCRLHRAEWQLKFNTTLKYIEWFSSLTTQTLSHYRDKVQKETTMIIANQKCRYAYILRYLPQDRCSPTGTMVRRAINVTTYVLVRHFNFRMNHPYWPFSSSISSPLLTQKIHNWCLMSPKGKSRTSLRSQETAVQH